jgi:hypothetical protein
MPSKRRFTLQILYALFTHHYPMVCYNQESKNTLVPFIGTPYATHIKSKILIAH